MLESKKRVFWEALLLTVVVFIFGLLLGSSFENSKLDEVNNYYLQSEISLMDILAVNNLASGDVSCEFLVEANLDLADRIYNEALLLEKYEESGKVTEGLKLAHQKYDVLRTFLWINSMKTKEQCEGDFNVVVYLYKYETEDLNEKAKQNAWSKVLYDLKQSAGDKVLLIPISTNNELSSLNFILRDLNLSEETAIVINNEFVVTDLSSVEDIGRYFI